MTVCPSCGTPGAPGALFCARCGHTLPQGEPVAPPYTPVPPPMVAPAPPAPPPAPSWGPPAPAGAPPAPGWVPPGLVGRARHCPNCNTLISPVAVVCPVCLAALPPASVGAGAGGGPVR